MLEINGVNYYHVFTAGKYPQGEISNEFLMQAANNYNPVDFHEAPVWIGHPSKETAEPEALGWIDKLIAKSEKLYVSFSFISEKLKSLIENKKFKRCSVELVTFNVAGQDFPYLYAIGITNRPAVKGLEPITFIEPVTFAGHNFKTDDISRKLHFNSEIKLQNKTGTSKMNELKKLAEKLNLDVIKFDTDDKLSKEIVRLFDDKSNEIQLLKNKNAKLLENESTAESGAKYTELLNELSKLKKARAGELIENAMLTKKLLPSQKADWFSVCGSQAASDRLQASN